MGPAKKHFMTLPKFHEQRYLGIFLIIPKMWDSKLSYNKGRAKKECCFKKSRGTTLSVAFSTRSATMNEKSVFYLSSLLLHSFILIYHCNVICDALRASVPFVKFKEHEKHPWRSVNFSKVYLGLVEQRGGTVIQRQDRRTRQKGG